MDDGVERLIWLRQRAGLANKAEAARAYGIHYEIYKKLEAGDRQLTPEQAETIARHHRVSPGWLMFGEGTAEGEMQIEVTGFIGAGGQVVLFEDHGSGKVDALIAGADAVALEVRGDSMFPLAYDKDIIFVGRPRRDVTRLIGREAAVNLQDGRRFFKILERGSKPGLYDLRSYNAEPIRDVEVHSAGAFFGVRRRFL